MNSRFLSALLCLLCVASALRAQQPVQTVRGSILDRESRTTLPYSVIMLYKDSVMIKNTEADGDGKFRITEVPIGRYSIKVNALGYLPYSSQGIVVDAGKETVLQITLEEQVNQSEGVTVIATKKASTVNEMATVSTRTFTVEETNRYAGSRQDPVRMASNFAGVQGNNDSRNDIVVRGNSPLGVVYRLEDVNILNPNHFGIAGTTGGPISMLNNYVIATSDFLTGAFPAEYGNSVAAVFDLHLRNGNNEKHEYTAQFGVLGAELAAEGPISRKSGSSFLFAYRYSTFDFLKSLHIPIGTNSVPHYQDLSFKLNFPMKKQGNLSFFGLGGLSNIALMVSNQEHTPSEIYGSNDRDQYFSTNMGMIGASYSKVMNKNAYFKVTLSTSQSGNDAHHELVHRDPVTDKVIFPTIPNMHYFYYEGRNGLSAFVNRKIGSRNVLKYGFYADQLTYSYIDSNLNILPGPDSGMFEHRWDSRGNTFLFQPYVQWKHKFTEKFLITAGLHAQYLTLNGSKALEPRVGARWDVASHQALSLGYGLHSQMQPLYVYFYHFPDTFPAGKHLPPHNLDMGFTRSHHVVLSYDNVISPSMRIKAETYYQYLFNVPVEKKPSSFSLLNEGSVFSRFFPDSLENTGTGRNFGIELTVEKFFSKSYFFLFTGSLYDSKYRGSDGILRNTDYNGNYALNALAGREFALGKRSSFTLGAKVTYAGGKRYSYPDLVRSLEAAETVPRDSGRNSRRFDPYFRADLKIGFKINRKRFTHEIAIDLVNIFNTRNVLALTFNTNYQPGQPIEKAFYQETQLGFLPLFYYKLDFTTK
jgi:hypothetical protein